MDRLDAVVAGKKVTGCLKLTLRLSVRMRMCCEAGSRIASRSGISPRDIGSRNDRRYRGAYRVV